MDGFPKWKLVPTAVSAATTPHSSPRSLQATAHPSSPRPQPGVPDLKSPTLAKTEILGCLHLACTRRAAACSSHKHPEHVEEDEKPDMHKRKEGRRVAHPRPAKSFPHATIWKRDALRHGYPRRMTQAVCEKHDRVFPKYATAFQNGAGYPSVSAGQRGVNLDDGEVPPVAPAVSHLPLKRSLARENIVAGKHEEMAAESRGS
ncbi:hypothetical protein FB45DRAFT_1029354 [Roridomyces roridus]|uniref:Uncharacterized protein n=1 Tax=Roridomyces roridus TaxID=1738132 RepID=A0AAD7BPG3_9AGAR|nr:hypothetical protein FB45DRAFT_1029354 [Roridomyces roridus]